MATISRPSPCRMAIPGLRSVAISLLFLVFLASCDSGPTGPSGPHSTDWIVFVSDRDGEDSGSGEELLDIYRVNLDGTELVNLTSHPTQLYSDLHLSPDRSTLLFRSTRSGCYEIWSMPPDSTEPLQLTGPGERCNTRPRWSPDGSMIAFNTSRSGALWEVYVMAADGSDPRNVSYDYGGEDPVTSQVHGWTPDGRVVFVRSGSEHNYFVVNPDGTGLEPLFPGVLELYPPFWSPDGSQVAFRAHVDGVLQLVIGNGDGTDFTPVSGEAGSLGVGHFTRPMEPWSPDGEQIVLQGDGQLYVMDADGSGLVPLTTGEASNAFHGWSPDGTRILFSGDQSGTHDIYVINSDGTGLERITDGAGEDRDAVWVPRGN